MVSSGRYGAFARRATLALLIGALVPLAGCRSADDVTGSINAPSSALPTSDEALRAYADDLGRRYDNDPGGKAISISYARALRSLGRFTQAVAVMQSAAVKAPKDMEVLGAYGKALADAGQLTQAADVLSRSYTPEEPNWSSMSTQGSIADQLGDHAQAQKYYHDALQLAPNRPEILSNLGLSYALSKRLPEAEQTLRQAAAQPTADRRVRDNLALVLALEGKFAEAQQVNERDMTPEAAAANVAAVRQMIAQSNSWREIQAADGRKRAKTREKLPDPDAPVQIAPQG
jgi:Flp pilus assembly protein TadD